MDDNFESVENCLVKVTFGVRDFWHWSMERGAINGERII